MHAEADHTERRLLPSVVAELLHRNDQRRAARRESWRQYHVDARRRAAAYDRMADSPAVEQGHERDRSIDADGLEL